MGVGQQGRYPLGSKNQVKRIKPHYESRIVLQTLPSLLSADSKLGTKAHDLIKKVETIKSFRGSSRMVLPGLLISEVTASQEESFLHSRLGFSTRLQTPKAPLIPGTRNLRQALGADPRRYPSPEPQHWESGAGEVDPNPGSPHHPLATSKRNIKPIKSKFLIRLSTLSHVGWSVSPARLCLSPLTRGLRPGALTADRSLHHRIRDSSLAF